MAFLSGLITALAGAGSSIINNLEAKNAAYDTRQYNSPAQQVNRLKQAGINPYALAPQIASNNTGEYVAGQTDYGGIASSAISAANSEERTRLSKLSTQDAIESMQEEIRGKQLDNEFKALTIQDRASFLTYKARLAELQGDYQAGLIDIQEYQKQQEFLRTEFQKYNAGIATETYGDPSETFVGGDIPDIANNNAQYTIKQGTADVKEFEAQLKRNMREFIEKEVKFRGTMTEAQYEYWAKKALREGIAYDYELDKNMPWANKNTFLHIFEAVMDNLGKNLQDPDIGVGEALWNSVLDYLGIPHGGQRQRSRKEQRAIRHGRDPHGNFNGTGASF